MIRLFINGKQISAECGNKLSAYLRIDSPCGGKAKCGKCKVIAKGELSPMTEREKSFLSTEEIAKGIRLACMAELVGETEIFTLEKGENRILTDGERVEYTINPIVKKYGLAVDIGTTTVVVGLYSASGELLGKTGMLNPQTMWGADVISRIERVLAGNGDELQNVIVGAIENTAALLCAQNGIDVTEIDGGVFTGNTAMLYLLTKTPVDCLARMPFSLTRPFGETIYAKDLGMRRFSPEMTIYLPPCISPFIGADTVCALLATSFWERKDTFMMVDVGTNGEMVFFNKGKMYACSTAAGPAFEGAGLSCGMRGEEGAIDHVCIENGKIAVRAIGDKEPKGICGSGVIDVIACLLQAEQLDETGYMQEAVEIAENVLFTPKDVRAVQLAKSAIYAGISTLLKTVEVETEAVKSFMLAGGFGGYVDLKNAGKIRLFPETWVPCTKILGNAAYNGAAALLLDKGLKERCLQAVVLTEVVDLSKSNIFMEEYAEGMTF